MAIMEKTMDSTMVFRVQGSGDLVSRLRMGIIRVTMWFIQVINYTY